MARVSFGARWPDLAVPGWEESVRTLHLWTQLMGKIRLALAPTINHWWHVPLYVTARGLGTSLIPNRAEGFDMELDLLDHTLEIRGSDGAHETLPLPREGTLAEFYRTLFDALHRGGVEVRIHPQAVEIPEEIHLDQDQVRRRYEPAVGERLFEVLLRSDHLFQEFRGKFLGKVSPVQFFWGSFDLAVTRFSGRTAPVHRGGIPHCPDRVTVEAYSHELSSAGFWPGGPQYPQPIFYSYAYAEPAGFKAAHVAPPAARYDPHLCEFVLPYEEVRAAPSPDDAVRTFLESTYAVAAELAHWNRAALERSSQQPMETEHELPL